MMLRLNSMKASAYVGILVCCALLLIQEPVSGQVQAKGEAPWLAAPFSADPKVMLKAASAVDARPGAEAVILFEDYRFVFDADGKKTKIWRMVYRVTSEAGVQNWASLGQGWEPWYQSNPRIRARVISPDGVGHELDLKTLTEAGVGEENRNVYSNSRALKGPLPAVSVGAVVEVETEVRDQSPFFDQGMAFRLDFGSSVSVQHTRLLIDYPSSLPLNYKIQLMSDLKPKREESGGRVQLLFERGAMEGWQDLEPYSSLDMARYPGVWFSTGKSWQSIAARYSQIVDEQIKDANRSELIGNALEGAKGREDIIWRLVRRLHDQVRYTGIEFDEASLVPRTPAETLQRKFGDCKDKSAMLVAMLRGAGMQAHVAVLRTAPRTNPDPGLPGMGEFDHAIVYVPGKPDYWIDATDEYARIDALDSIDQDRLALVISPASTELTRTPEMPVTQNRVIETREFFLAPMGPARVVETSEYSGGSESNLRSAYAVQDPKQSKEALQNYFDESYLAQEPIKFEHTSPKDFSQRFRLRIESMKATRGNTGLQDAAVAIFPAGITGQLPTEFRNENENLAGGEEEEEETPKPKKDKPKRKGELILPETLSLEWRYRITPPAGYKVRSLPEAGTEKLGPAVLTKEFKQGADGMVTGTMLFEVAKRRMSAEEAEALREAVLKLQKSEVMMVNFSHSAFDHLEAGRVREALAEFRAISSKEADVAVNHVRTARGMLAAGLGEAARAEARRATVEDPKSSLAWQTLGWILQHDILGRRFKKGFDLSGAIAAYRKAAELDAESLETHGDLAILLEHNADGVRYGKGAKLEEAIQEYLKVKDKMKGTGLAANIPIAYMKAGKFKEMREETKALAPGSNQRQVLLLVATAALEGSAAAIQQAAREVSGDEERRSTLNGAGVTLAQIRLYAIGADLLAASARGATNATAILGQAEMYRKAVRYEDLKLSAADPQSAVKQFLGLTFSPERPTKEDLIALISKAAADELLKENERDPLAELISARSIITRSGLPPDVGRDLVMANMQLSAEGIEGGDHRIRSQTPGTGPSTFIVIRENGAYRLLDQAESATSVGLEVLWRVDRGDLAGARRLLDWVREAMPLGGGDDPFAGNSFPRLWEKGKEADAAAIRVAGASLVVTTPNANLAVPILRAAREKASTDAEKTALNLALAAAYSKLEKYDEVLAIGRELAKSNPASDVAFQMVARSLNALQRLDEATAYENERLKGRPNDALALRMLASTEGFRGNFAGAIAYLRQLATLGKATASDYNEMAWNALFIQPMPKQAGEDAERAVQLSQNAAAGIVHTLAAVWAEAGKTNEAQAAMLQSLDLYGTEEPNSEIWFLYGRLAESFGEKETAVAAYKKVEKPKNIERQPTATYLLAQRNLKKM